MSAKCFATALALVAQDVETLVKCMRAIEDRICDESGGTCARYRDAAWALAARGDKCLVKITLSAGRPIAQAPAPMSLQHYSATIIVECTEPAQLVSTVDNIIKAKIGQPDCGGTGLTVTS